MFKSKNSNQNSNTNRQQSQGYAFSQPNTANLSSTQIAKQEKETFYQPLPVPSSQSPTLPPSNSNSNSNSNNPFSDPINNREYISRTPSPLHNASPNNPLLQGYSQGGLNSPSSNSPFTPQQAQSPVNMPNPSRNYGPRANAASGGPGMPQRGDSQSALLGIGSDYRQQVSLGFGFGIKRDPLCVGSQRGRLWWLVDLLFVSRPFVVDGSGGRWR